MSTDTRITRLLLSSAIKRCRRRSGQTACPIRYRTMHAQQRSEPEVELDHPATKVVPFRPLPSLSSQRSNDTAVRSNAAAEAKLTSAEPEDDVEQVQSRFPLYRAEPHFKLEERGETPSIPELKGPLLKELSQLENDIPRLVKTLNQKQKLEMSETETEHLPEWTEEQLITFYHALESWSAGAVQDSADRVKAIGQADEAKGIAPPEREESLMLVPQSRQKLPRTARREILSGLVERLSALDQDSPKADDDEVKAHNEGSTQAGSPASSGNEAVSTVILEQRALDMIQRLTPKLSGKTISELEQSTEYLPTGLLRQVEWDAMVDSFVSKRQFETAASVLEQMKNHGVPVGQKRIEDLMRAYARTGDAVGLGSFLERREKSTGIETSKRHLEFMVEAHLARGDKAAALHTLHHFEKQGKILPQRAYTRVISSYTAGTTRSTISPTPQHDKAVAWDLFAHMRLVAHPVPSRSTYNAMIMSCADPQDPQPERALDLLTGMEQESKLVPDGETFDAAILACSRVKGFYLEGFKLLKRMLGLHQSAMLAKNFISGSYETASDSLQLGITGYEPTLTTFNALLEGCKRRGDLSRTRWLLGEVIRLVRGGAGRGVDEEMVVNVLHCYAAFQPVISKASIKLSVATPAESSVEPIAEDPIQAEEVGTVSSEVSTLEDEPPKPMTLFDVGSPDFSPPKGPQTAYEALQEAERLFQLVLHDQGDQASPFGWLKISARTVNAYLSVRFAHDNLASAIQHWQAIWSEPVLQVAQVEKNGWSYVTLLERCASASKGSERQAVASILEKVWQEYLEWVDKVDRQIRDQTEQEAWVMRQRLGLGPRQVEKAWMFCIRSLALLDRNRDALDVLERFKSRFPASDIVTPVVPDEGRTSVPRIRLSSEINLLEDQVPPHLLFHDISILHQRLVRDGDLQGVGLVKWACVSYEKALETRRSRRLNSKKQQSKGTNKRS